MDRTDLRGRSALVTGALVALPLLTGLGLWLSSSGETPEAPAKAATPLAAGVPPAAPRSTAAALSETPDPDPPQPPHADESPAADDPAPSDLAAALTEGGDPLEALSERSLLLVLDVTAREVALADVVSKDLAYRRLELRAAGPYVYLLEDAGGNVLHAGRFEVPDLCPLVGVEHLEDHVSGHVAVEHRGVALVRVPDLPGAVRVVFGRAIPDLDRDPRSLGSVDLPERS